MFTSPTSGHATARAALAAGLRPWQAPEEAKKLADENDGGNKDGAA
jgi:multisubunit Na+/H+ antiporter MnhG subunit